MGAAGFCVSALCRSRPTMRLPETAASLVARHFDWAGILRSYFSALFGQTWVDPPPCRTGYLEQCFQHIFTDRVYGGGSLSWLRFPKIVRMDVAQIRHRNLLFAFCDHSLAGMVIAPPLYDSDRDLRVCIWRVNGDSVALL